MLLFLLSTKVSASQSDQFLIWQRLSLLFGLPQLRIIDWRNLHLGRLLSRNSVEFKNELVGRSRRLLSLAKRIAGVRVSGSGLDFHSLGLQGIDFDAGSHGGG
jgi:hypothetical protein